MKRVKKISIVLLVVLTVCCFGIFGYNSTMAKATDTQDEVTLSDTKITIAGTDCNAIIVDVDGTTESIRLGVRNGASIRLTGDNAIRFSSFYSKDDYDALVGKYQAENVEIGSILVLTGDKEGEYFTQDITFDAHGDKDLYSVKAVKTLNYTSKIVRFNAVLTGIPANKINTNISVRSYVKITKDGDSYYGYSDYDYENNTRTLARVAKAAANDAEVVYTNAVRKNLEALMAEDKTNDIVLVKPADSSNLKTAISSNAIFSGKTVTNVYDTTLDNDNETSEIDYEEFLSGMNQGDSKPITVYCSDGTVYNTTLVLRNDTPSSVTATQELEAARSANEFNTEILTGFNADNLKYVLLNGKKLNYSINENNLVIDGSQFDITDRNDSKLDVVCTDKDYSVTLDVLDLVIKNVSDLELYAKNFSKYNRLVSHIALGNDIDANGLNINKVTDATFGNYYNGTFDGRGHVIYNLHFNEGLVGAGLSSSCTVKNIGLVNPVIEQQRGGCIGNFANTNSVIENVFITGLVFTGNQQGAICPIVLGAVRNCLIEAEKGTEMTGAWTWVPGFVAYTYGYSNGGSISNVYGISSTINSFWATQNGTFTNSDKYVSVSAFENAKGSLETFVNGLGFDCLDVDFSKNIDLAMDADNSIDLTKIDATLTANDVISVSVKGSQVAFTTNGNKIEILGSALSGIGRLDGEIIIRTTKGIFVESTFVANYIISSVSDFTSLFKAGFTSSGKYIALASDLDFKGADITSNTGYAGCGAFSGTLDGRGHAIYNAQTTHGLFANVTGGTIKNLAYINPIKLTNGGGLIANENYSGVIDNCFVYGTMTNASQCCMGASGTPTVTNCLVYVSGIGADAVAANAGNVSNVKVISQLPFKVNGQKGNVQYADLDAFETANGTLSNYLAEMGFDVDFDLEYLPSYEAQFSTYLASNTIDLADIDAELSASDIAYLKLGGKVLSYTTNNNVLTVASSEVSSISNGNNTLEVITKTNKTYLTKALVATFIINNASDLEYYGTNFDKLSTKKAQLVVLNADVDATGITSLKGENFNLAYSNHSFDGRGHVISNLSVKWGLMGIGFHGTLKNLVLVNPVADASANKGIICRYVFSDAVMENCVVINPIFTASQQGVILSLGTGTTTTGGTVKNCVIVAEKGANASQGIFATNDVYNYGGTVDGVYGISQTIADWYVQHPSYPVTKTNSVIYKTYADFVNAKGSIENIVGYDCSNIVLNFASSFDFSGYSDSYIDLSKVDSTLTANEITGVTVNGVKTAFSIEGNSLKVSNTNLATCFKGKGLLVLETNEKTYVTSSYYADLIIKDQTTFNAFFVGFQSTYSKAGSLVAMGANYDAGNVNVSTEITGSTIEKNVYYSGRFDGRGYTVSNVKVVSGFFGLLGYGTVENFGLKNVTLTTDKSGAFGKYIMTGTVKNCYLVLDIPTTGWYGGIVFRVGSSTGAGCYGGSVENCVIIATGGNKDSDGFAGEVAEYNHQSNLKNVYGVSTVLTQMWVTQTGTATNTHVYTSVDGLNGDTADGNALTTLNGQGYWKVVEGKLYFNNTKVGE